METRLEAIDRLKRKYGQSIAEILAFLEEVRGQIASVEHAGERMEALRKEQKRLAGEFEKAARELTEARKAAARQLEKRVEAELAQLAMERTVFRVRSGGGGVVAGGRRPRGVSGLAERGRRAASAGEGGIGRRDFAPRAGAEDLPGGPEDAAWLRTLVFDEVDTGVGGSAAEGVGRRLKKLAAANQVLCVTHLPQIAIVRRSPLSGGEAGIGRTHGRGDRGTGCARRGRARSAAC